MRSRTAILGASVLVGTLFSHAGRGETQDGPTLLFGGDVIFDATTVYALRQMDASPDDPRSYAAMFEELDLDRADLTIVNLETPIAERIRERGGAVDQPVFAAPAAFLEALARAGVDAVGLANNHAYDQGAAGLAETCAHARALGIVPLGVGPGRDAAFGATIVTRGGYRIAIVAATDGTNHVPGRSDPSTPRIAVLGEERLEESLRAARDRADLVIADLHWTSASTALPTPQMRHIVERAAAAGADLVVAHGPHVPGPRLTIHTPDGRDVPVLVSLGNLAAVMRAGDDELYAERPSVRDAVLARVATRRSATGHLEVVSITAHAFFISASRSALFPGARTRFVRPLSIARELERASTCGAPCAELRAGYEARRDRLTALFCEAPGLLASPTPSPAPPVASPPSLVPGGDGPFDLGLVFAANAPRVLTHDEARAAVLAARLRDDHALSVVLVSHPGPEGDRRAADRRAHAARGLVSVLGPSRSRFEIEIGESEEIPRVEVLVRRRSPVPR